MRESSGQGADSSTESSDKSVCPECGRGFDTYTGMRTHLFQHCGGDTSVECSFCGSVIEGRPPAALKGKENVYCDIDCRSNAGSVRVSCDGCGMHFRKKRSRYERSENDYCGRDCPGRKSQRECCICGEMFEVFESNNDQQTCSYECMGKMVGDVEYTECDYCGDSYRYYAWNGRGRFCSRRCYFMDNGETGPEESMRLLLDKLGVEYVQEWPIPGTRYVADFYLPNRSTIIEVDGEYWHSLDGMEKRDRKKDIACGLLGYSMMRVSGCEADDIANEFGLRASD